MKNFKVLLLGALVIYLLSITACKKNAVEVIPGGLNSNMGQEYYGNVVGTAKQIYSMNQ